MKLVFFDYETAGFSGKGASWYPDGNIDAYTRPVSCCYIVTDENRNILKEVYNVLKPIDENGKIFSISSGAEKVHGISVDHALEFGVDCAEFHKQFMEDLKDADYVITHNGITFDIPIFIATCIRHGFAEQQFDNAAYNLIPPEKRIDTCKDAAIKQWVGAVNKNNRLKMPNMTEFHIKCFNEPFKGAHNAHGDVIALKDCFFYALEHNIITLNK